MTSSRAERRLATQARVLAGARKLFAERGFERTTIRAVADAAGVDPSLVMQYFGSKRDLFARAVEASAPAPDATSPDELVDSLLESLGLKLGKLPDSTLATLRSMLTDPAAAEHARAALGRQIEAVRSALPTPEEAEVRAALLISAVVGVTIAHQLLGLEALREVPAERIAGLLRPALRALAGSG